MQIAIIAIGNSAFSDSWCDECWSLSAQFRW